MGILSGEDGWKRAGSPRGPFVPPEEISPPRRRPVGFPTGRLYLGEALGSRPSEHSDLPRDSGWRPDEQGEVLFHAGTRPDESRASPNGSGARPNASGVPPTASGTLPDEKGELLFHAGGRP